MKQKQISKKIFLFLVALLGFAGMNANPLAVPVTSNCTASYSITNAQGIVLTTGALTNQNNIPLGALCPGFNLVVKLTSPTTTLIGAYVSISTSSTPITYTLQNFNTNIITVPITAYDPTQTLPGSITVGFAPQYTGDGCYVFLFDVYPAPNPAFVISPNPVCLNSTVCFSLTGASSNPLASQYFGYFNGNMSQTLYNNIANNLVSPNYSGTLSCNPATSFGLGTFSITNVGAYNSLSGFCFNSVTHTFQVVPALGAITVSSPTVPICSGQAAVLTASALGATSYTWYPGAIVGNSITVNPTISTSYTVVASNINNCTNTAIANVEVVPCCLTGRTVINLSNVNIVAPGASTLVWSSLASGGNYSGNIALPNSTYIIQGAYNVIGGLTISTPVSIANSHIAFADAISVNQNDVTSIDRSYWHGCDKNWRGIISKKQLTVTNSVIEDAYKAIDAQAPSTSPIYQGLYVDNTIFNKNTYGMILNGTNFNAYRLTGSIFTSRDIPAVNYVYTTGQRWTSLSNFSNAALAAYSIGYMKGSSILSVLSTDRGQMGINFSYATNIVSGANPVGYLTAGDVSSTPTTNASYTNVFDGLRLGIISAGSKNVLYNNYFQNINYLSSADFSPTTACFYNTGNRSVVGSSTNGSAGVPYANSFNNSLNGIYGTSNGTLSVTNNQFYNLTQYSVWIDNWLQSSTNTTTLAVTNNTFTTCLYDLYASSNFSINLNFSNNVATYPFQTIKPKVTYHAYVLEFANPVTAVYNISFNNAIGKVNGVYCINAYAPAVTNNTLVVRTPIGAGLNAPVWLDHTDQGNIKYNTLSVSPSNSHGLNTYGIFTNVGNNNLFCENVITGAGSSMKFQGTSPSRIYRNNLNTNPTDLCLYGIQLDNNGYVGPIKYNTACAENIFGDYDYSGGGADTYAQNGSAGSTIDYPGTNSPTNQYCPFVNLNSVFPPATSFTSIPNALAGQAVCSSAQLAALASSSPLQLSSSQNLSTGVPVIMSNALNFSANNTNAKTIANKSTYEMARKSGINVASIAGGNNFMNTNAGNNNGNFYKMDSLVHVFAANGNTATLNQAKNLNTVVSPTNNIETNQKSFNTIYHTYMSNPSLITSANITTLKSLAALCPFTDGTSVYQARALVKRYDTTQYFNPCEYNASATNSGSRFISTDTELNTSNDALSTQVYPNPASTEITVSTDLDGAKLLIFNIVGQMILHSELSTLTKVDVSDLKNGTYIYKIVKNNIIIKADKLIISK